MSPQQREVRKRGKETETQTETQTKPTMRSELPNGVMTQSLILGGYR